MLRLYDYLSSGNGYKVRLLLSQLGLPFERIDLDLDKGETRTPAFLKLNPNGKIPALQLESGEVLPESDAILFYLAEGTPFLPDDRLERARVLQWMFFEQYSHEPNIAVARFWHMHGEMTEEQKALLPEKHEKGYAALSVMESHLADRPFFVAERYTVADIALYAYTHVAPEGGFDLEPYPALRRWLDRVASQPGYIPITQG
ncbi:MAG: glutathione S-transferase family protein [Alphaproteobacteria bacterium]|nr:glutathione S-transferase family protein [Alphaproteobacteria bacterium]